MAADVATGEGSVAKPSSLKETATGSCAAEATAVAEVRVREEGQPPVAEAAKATLALAEHGPLSGRPAETTRAEQPSATCGTCQHAAGAQSAAAAQLSGGGRVRGGRGGRRREGRGGRGGRGLFEDAGQPVAATGAVRAALNAQPQIAGGSTEPANGRGTAAHAAHGNQTGSRESAATNMNVTHGGVDTSRRQARGFRRMPQDGAEPRAVQPGPRRGAFRTPTKGKEHAGGVLAVSSTSSAVRGSWVLKNEGRAAKLLVSD
eukprot:4722312-Pleurochrysis_carterae.AAC.2